MKNNFAYIHCSAVLSSYCTMQGGRLPALLLPQKVDPLAFCKLHIIIYPIHISVSHIMYNVVNFGTPLHDSMTNGVHYVCSYSYSCLNVGIVTEQPIRSVLELYLYIYIIYRLYIHNCIYISQNIILIYNSQY